MNLEFLTTFFAPVIVGVCLCVGYLVKRWVKDVDNRFIPTICAGVGLGLAVWIYWPALTPDVLLVGLFSGLAATGLHEAFRNLLNGGGE
jgi:hypothetical protein